VDQGERWLPVVGYEGVYEVSDRGRVKRLANVVTMKNGVRRSLREIMLKCGPDKNGYPYVNLTTDKRARHWFVHRLVLLAFRGPPPDGHEACHGDGDKTNGRLGNLRWGTKMDNEMDKLIHGTRFFGEKHWKNRLSTNDAVAIKGMLKRGDSHAVIAARFGVSTGAVNGIKAGRSWSWL
jgi:hypothetical protein